MISSEKQLKQEFEETQKKIEKGDDHTGECIIIFL